MGALLTGFLARPRPTRSLNTNLAQIVGKTLWLEQLKAMGVTIAIALTGTLILATLVKALTASARLLIPKRWASTTPITGKPGYHFDEAGG